MAGSKAPSRKTVERAFRRFVELVKPIPQVHHVVAFDDHGGDIFTLIERRDLEVCKAVFNKEDQVMDEIPELESAFHVIYLEGRPLEEHIHTLPRLVFSRRSIDADD